VPWAKLGCGDILALDGGGIAAAARQIASAAALWLEKHKSGLPRDWRRVEAVRHALFSSAALPASDKKKYLGRGLLRAQATLAVAPRLASETPDTPTLRFLRVMDGLGVSDEKPGRARRCSSSSSSSAGWRTATCRRPCPTPTAR
jgi:hypothetical protein